MELDESSYIPLHVQVKQILSDEIASGHYKDRIPSERELMARFSISRTTVREAISALVREGLLEKRHGKGTFITNKPLQEWLGQLRSFTETVNYMGMTPRFKLLSQKRVTPNRHISEILDAKAEDVCLIVRSLYANDQPVAIEKQYYPLEIGDRLQQYNLNEAVLYDLLERELGIVLAEAEQTITGDHPTGEEAAILGIPQKMSVLRIERIIYDAHGEPVEYLKGCFRSDLYSFRIKMSRR